MTELPAPLTPVDCNLRGLRWMPLDVGRVLDSDLFGLSSGDEFKTAFCLWAKSWTQVPAASLPDDDRLLAHLAGLSGNIAKWRKVRAMALRGWIKCSDGRLYHPVIAEKAIEAMQHRDEYVEKNGNERTRQQRHRDRRRAMFNMLRAHGVVPPFDTATAELEALVASLPASPETPSGTQSVTGETSLGTSRETHNESQEASPATHPQRLMTGHDRTVNGNPANDDVGSLIWGGAVDKSGVSLLPADKIVGLLTQWESKRGKSPRFAVTDKALQGWRVCADQLRRAYDDAVEQRIRDHDPTPVNAGFLDAFIAKQLAPPRVVMKPLRNMTDTEFAAEERRLGVTTRGLSRELAIAKFDEARRASEGRAT